MVERKQKLGLGIGKKKVKKAGKEQEVNQMTAVAEGEQPEKKAVKKSVKANTAKKTVRKPDTNASLRNSNIRTAPVCRIPNNAA